METNETFRMVVNVSYLINGFGIIRTEKRISIESDTDSAEKQTSYNNAVSQNDHIKTLYCKM